MRLRIAPLILTSLALACSDKKEAPPAAPPPVETAPVAEQLTQARPEDLKTLKALPGLGTELRLIIPPRCELVISSPDAQAWREGAMARPYVQQLMKTPLWTELKASGIWQKLKAAEGALLSASKLAIHPGDADALLRGPTAFALCTRGFEPEPRYRYWMLLKQLKGAEPNAIRLAANVARAVKALNLDRHGGPEVYRAEGLGIALYNNMLIFSDDVEQLSEALMAEAEARAVVPAALMPSDPGLHLALLPNEKRTGLAQLGISFPVDPKKPPRVRVVTNAKRAPSKLLKYAPAEAIAAVSPADAAGVDPLAIFGEAAAMNNAFDNTGSALVLGARAAADAPADLGPLLIIGHNERGSTLKAVTRILGYMNKKKTLRTRTPEGDSLLGPAGAGLCAAVTADAVLFSLSKEGLRAALAAGQGKAGSLGDRIKAELDGPTPGLFYLDNAKLGAFLGAFYSASLPKVEQVSKALLPSFKALGAGGAWVGGLKAVPGEQPYLEGELRAVP